MTALLGEYAGNFNPAKRIFMPMAGVDYSGYLNGGSIPMVPYTSGIGLTPGLSALSGITGSNFDERWNKMSQAYEERFVRNNFGGLSINDAIADFQSRLVNNESDKIPTTWQEFKNSLRNSQEYKLMQKHGLIDEKTLNSFARAKYGEISGKNIETAIEENTHGDFVSGLINGATFGGLGGYNPDKSSTQIKEETLGIEQPKGSAAKRVIGSAAGGTCAGAAIGAAIGAAVCGIPSGGTAAIPGAILGAKIGVGIGVVCGLISKLWS